jgi:serine/threonine protein kinase
MKTMILGKRYEIIEKIGEGGMAIVYKAKCRLLNRYVAVKILRTEYTGDEEFVRRFQAEAQSAKLSHSNIVPIYDVGSENGVHYIVMEYVEGLTLKEYIKKNGRLKWKDAVNIAAQISSALDHAHKNGIIHRDIKPQNIIITHNNVAKVTDFGIAKFANGATITLRDKTMGSVHYFSPEQARGTLCDAKSDIYSLGIVLYEMLTNMLPFNGDMPVTVALKQIQEEAKPVIEIYNDIPIGLNDIVIKAMKKNPNERYESAAKMFEDLVRVLKQPYAQFLGKVNENDDQKTVVRIPIINVQANPSDAQVGNFKSGDINGMNKIKTTEKKLKKWMYIIIGMIAFIVLAIVIVLVTTSSQQPKTSTKDEVTIKNYVGKKYEEVRSELTSYSIATFEKDEYNETYEKGLVISQDTPEGQILKANEFSSITFTVSLGTNKITIPNVNGKSKVEAKAELEALGLVVSELEEFNDLAIGLVTRTEPTVNAKVSIGDEVKIYISKGKETVRVTIPDLENKTLKEVTQILDSKKLTLGKMYPASEQGIDVTAIVTSQKPFPNTQLNEGESVDIYFNNYVDSNNRTLYTERIDWDNMDGMADVFKLSIKVKYSDTQAEEFIIQDLQLVKKDIKPYYFQIAVPVNGSTSYDVYIDGALYKKNARNNGGY